MNFEESITDLKKEIDRELDTFLNFKEAEGRKNEMPVEFFEAVENVRNFVIRGGKRLRPILFYYGYVLAGGSNKKEALRTSIALEFLHTGLLIHDDIMDQDDIRHNGMSVHTKYAYDYGVKLGRSDLQHFGYSMAICLGDLATSTWSYEILAKSGFKDKYKIRTIAGLSDIIAETSVGQMLDETLQVSEDFDESHIYRVHDFKTARYTIRGPLQLGAILAGAENEELGYISRFAIPLGISYQVKDDIIGIFGEEEKIGKPVGSDIREGKKTLLISYALRKSSEADRSFILSQLGNKGLSRESLEKMREIITETGSLKYSEDKMEELSQEALNNLRGGKKKYVFKYAMLEEFAHFLLRRKN
jgi:geranylgeranyl diphosphate synthase type I